MAPDENSENTDDQEQEDVFDEITESTEDENDEEEIEEEFKLSEEEDRAIQRKYRIDKGKEGFEPTLSEYDELQIERGTTTYDEIKGWEWDTQDHGYFEEKIRVSAKKQFISDLDTSFDGIENFSKFMGDYYNLIKDGYGDGFREQRKEIHENTKQIGKDNVENSTDDLFEDGSIDQRGYSYLIDEFIK
ncbi:hypothetical protein ACFL6B_03785 [Thermodesulfobacteriota bacterium]